MTHSFSEPPPWACLLIGGKSSRMGRPKHLLPTENGGVWLERAVALLRPWVAGVALAGAGEIPHSLTELPRLADAPGGQGPLVGIVAALRFKPKASWLIVACDMPRVTAAAIAWLLSAPRPGDVAVLPRLAANQGGSARPQPLFAWYGPNCRPLLEERLARGRMRLYELAAHPGVYSPLIPPELAASWSNINTPEELAALSRERRESEREQAGEQP